MSKFNNWMVEKGYGIIYDDKLAINYNDNCDAHILGSKQMLVGYMIEYLLDNDIWFTLNDNLISIDATYIYLKRLVND